MGFFKEISRNFSFSKGGDVNEVVIAGSQEFERAPSPVALLGAQSRVAQNGIAYPALLPGISLACKPSHAISVQSQQ